MSTPITEQKARELLEYKDDFYDKSGEPHIELKKAYKRAALKWHPDKNLHRLQEANKNFILLSSAYDAITKKLKFAASSTEEVKIAVDSFAKAREKLAQNSSFIRVQEYIKTLINQFPLLKPYLINPLVVENLFLLLTRESTSEKFSSAGLTDWVHVTDLFEQITNAHNIPNIDEMVLVFPNNLAQASDAGFIAFQANIIKLVNVEEKTEEKTSVPSSPDDAVSSTQEAKMEAYDDAFAKFFSFMNSKVVRHYPPAVKQAEMLAKCLWDLMLQYPELKKYFNDPEIIQGIFKLYQKGVFTLENFALTIELAFTEATFDATRGSLNFTIVPQKLDLLNLFKETIYLESASPENYDFPFNKLDGQATKQFFNFLKEKNLATLLAKAPSLKNIRLIYGLFSAVQNRLVTLTALIEFIGLERLSDSREHLLELLSDSRFLSDKKGQNLLDVLAQVDYYQAPLVSTAVFNPVLKQVVRDKSIVYQCSMLFAIENLNAFIADTKAKDLNVLRVFSSQNPFSEGFKRACYESKKPLEFLRGFIKFRASIPADQNLEPLIVERLFLFAEAHKLTVDQVNTPSHLRLFTNAEVFNHYLHLESKDDLQTLAATIDSLIGSEVSAFLRFQVSAWAVIKNLKDTPHVDQILIKLQDPNFVYTLFQLQQNGFLSLQEVNHYATQNPELARQFFEYLAEPAVLNYLLKVRQTQTFRDIMQAASLSQDPRSYLQFQHDIWMFAEYNQDYVSALEKQQLLSRLYQLHINGKFNIGDFQEFFSPAENRAARIILLTEFQSREFDSEFIHARKLSSRTVTAYLENKLASKLAVVSANVPISVVTAVEQLESKGICKASEVADFLAQEEKGSSSGRLQLVELLNNKDVSNHFAKINKNPIHVFGEFLGFKAELANYPAAAGYFKDDVIVHNLFKLRQAGKLTSNDLTTLVDTVNNNKDNLELLNIFRDSYFIYSCLDQNGPRPLDLLTRFLAEVNKPIVKDSIPIFLEDQRYSLLERFTLYCWGQKASGFAEVSPNGNSMLEMFKLRVPFYDAQWELIIERVRNHIQLQQNVKSTATPFLPLVGYLESAAEKNVRCICCNIFNSYYMHGVDQEVVVVIQKEIDRYDAEIVACQARIIKASDKQAKEIRKEMDELQKRMRFHKDKLVDMNTMMRNQAQIYLTQSHEPLDLKIVTKDQHAREWHNTIIDTCERNANEASKQFGQRDRAGRIWKRVKFTVALIPWLIGGILGLLIGKGFFSKTYCYSLPNLLNVKGAQKLHEVVNNFGNAAIEDAKVGDKQRKEHQFDDRIPLVLPSSPRGPARGPKGGG